MLLMNIRLALHFMDEEKVKKLIVAMICPRLEYAAIKWSSHIKKHIHKNPETIHQAGP